MRAIRRWLPLLLGGLIVSAPLYRPLLFSDRALLFRDITRDFLPNKTYLAQALAQGDGIPYWNHLLFGGTPFYAVNTSAPLHPLNFLFLLFSESAKATVFYLWAHYLLLYLGCYLVARAMDLGRWGSMLLAAAFPVSGLLLSAHSLPHYLASAAAAPFWLYGLMRFQRTKSPPSLWLTGAALGWPIYGGDPFFTYCMAAASLGLISRALASRSIKDKIIAYGALGLSSALFSAAQLLPTAGHLLSSSRMNLSTEEILSFSLHPLRAAEIVVPLAFGNIFGQGSTFFGGSLVNFYFPIPFLFSIYPGLFLLLLAGTQPAKDKKQLYLLVGAGLALLFSLGSFLQPSLYKVALALLPGMEFFRYPERLVFWAFFLLWLASLRSWLWLAKNPQRPSQASWIFPGFLLGFSLLALALYRTGATPMPAHWHLGAGGSAVLAATWIGCRLLQPAPYARGALMAFGLLSLALDITATGQKLVWDQSIHTLDIRRYPFASAIKEDLGKLENNGQATRLASFLSEQQPFWTGQLDPTTASTNFSLHALVPNTAMLYGIADASGYLSMEDHQQRQLVKTLVQRGSGVIDFRFAEDLLAVRYVPERTLDGSVRLRINTSAQPYAFFPSKVWFAGKSAEAVAIMRGTEFRANKDLVIESDVSSAPQPQAQAQGGDQIRILRRNGKEIALEIQTHANSPRYFVVNESYHKHWHAYLDEAPVALERANQWSMAVQVPASAGLKPRVLSLRYHDPLIPGGLWLSGLWWVVLAGMALFSRWRAKSIAQPRPGGIART